MIKIKIKKLDLNSVLPKKSTKQAACYDVVAREVIVKDNLATIKLGFSTEIPIGYKGVIVPRSSFTQKGWVMQNSPGQIDSDYRGEWMIKFEAIPRDVVSYIEEEVNSELILSPFPYKEGDRVAQIFFEKTQNAYWEEVETLRPSIRDDGGFGSTGK